MAKIIQTENYIKIAGSTGDNQFPSSEPKHDKGGQGSVLFDDTFVPASEEEIINRWKPKKKKKKKKINPNLKEILRPSI